MKRLSTALIWIALGCANDAPADADTAVARDAAVTRDGAFTFDATMAHDAAIATDAAVEPRLRYGVNIHHGGASFAANQQLADLLQPRGMRTVRMDFNYDDDPTLVRDQITRLAAAGIRAEAVLFPSYQWSTSCTLDLAMAEASAYDQTRTMVAALQDLVTDFELMNEVTLRSTLEAEVPPWDLMDASAYHGMPCYAVQAAVLHGMTHAIRDAAVTFGRPFRVIAGAVGRGWGYLSFLREQGIDFDVLGYHIYPSEGQAPLDTDPWFGTGGLFAQLAQFHRPVQINELDCGEIYDASFVNQPGGTLTEQCLRSVRNHLLEISRQTSVEVESVHFYEMFDEPDKAPPENRFGLWYSPTAPKVLLLLATAFSGGTLSDAEASEVTSRGLLTTAQITAFRQ